MLVALDHHKNANDQNIHIHSRISSGSYKTNERGISNQIETTKYRTNDQLFVEDRLINYKRLYDNKVKKKNELKTVDFFKPRVDRYVKSSRYLNVQSKLPVESRVKRQRKFDTNSNTEKKPEIQDFKQESIQVENEQKTDFSKKESIEGNDL